MLRWRGNDEEEAAHRRIDGKGLDGKLLERRILLRNADIIDP